jgi:hypothetical protein
MSCEHLSQFLMVLTTVWSISVITVILYLERLMFYSPFFFRITNNLFLATVCLVDLKCEEWNFFPLALLLIVWISIEYSQRSFYGQEIRDLEQRRVPSEVEENRPEPRSLQYVQVYSV